MSTLCELEKVKKCLEESLLTIFVIESELPKSLTQHIRSGLSIALGGIDLLIQSKNCLKHPEKM